MRLSTLLALSVPLVAIFAPISLAQPTSTATTTTTSTTTPAPKHTITIQVKLARPSDIANVLDTNVTTSANGTTMTPSTATFITALSTGTGGVMGQGIKGWNATVSMTGPRPTNDMANAAGRVELGFAMVVGALSMGVLQVLM